MLLKDFNETFADELKDPDFATAYLQAALEEGVDAFLIALKDVARVSNGMANMEIVLSEHGNPEFGTLNTLLHSFGMRFAITRDAQAAAHV